MFSRTSLLAGERQARAIYLISRLANTTACVPKFGDSKDASGSAIPRPTRAEFGPKVRMGFIPESFFTMFYDKTGVTGPYMLGVGVATYLCSKEIYVMEHEYYAGLSIAVMIAVAMNKLGPGFGAYLDKEIDDIEKEWDDSRVSAIKFYKDAVEMEKIEQDSAEGQNILMAAKKENIALQLEAAYRERIVTAYRAVKSRLDYQVDKQTVERRITQKHMVNWVVDQVMKSITPDQEKATLQKCITELGAIAASIPKGGK